MGTQKLFQRRQYVLLLSKQTHGPNEMAEREMHQMSLTFCPNASTSEPGEDAGVAVSGKDAGVHLAPTLTLDAAGWDLLSIIIFWTWIKLP